MPRTVGLGMRPGRQSCKEVPAPWLPDFPTMYASDHDSPKYTVPTRLRWCRCRNLRSHHFVTACQVPRPLLAASWVCLVGWRAFPSAPTSLSFQPAPLAGTSFLLCDSIVESVRATCFCCRPPIRLRPDNEAPRVWDRVRSVFLGPGQVLA